MLLIKEPTILCNYWESMSYSDTLPRVPASRRVVGEEPEEVGASDKGMKNESRATRP